jgi:L,D-peptidoglycan transpeptidase YkuD (ErfK/YbiS/YcfS/YnhG family)
MRFSPMCGWSAIALVAVMAPLRAQQPTALQQSTQVLIVTTANWNTTAGVLQPIERTTVQGKWQLAGDPVTVAVGRNGLGWGLGLVPRGALAGNASDGQVKREGDGKAPAGLFNLGTVFGYAAQEPAGWKMRYTELTATVECVDDASSAFYNQVVDRATVKPDWNSSEKMRHAGEVYRWGLVIDNNSNPVTRGSGSCVFMHIWMGPGVPTSGCTAMPEERLTSILAWLDPARKPLLLQLTYDDYKKLGKRWKLPKLPPPGRG